jgi:polyhydroxybutyrate depolymerase
MHRHRMGTLLAAVLMTGLAACGARGAGPQTTLPSPPQPGRFTLVLPAGGHNRIVHVHIPPGYRSDGRVPLVLLLHGGGGNGEYALDQDRWADTADREGFVVFAPDGLGGFPNLPEGLRVNPRLWNDGQFPADSPMAAVDDVAFLTQLLTDLRRLVPHDVRRVYCVGHSNGGGMTLRLAAESSLRFAAIGTVSGTLGIDAPRLDSPPPTLAILGTRDPIVPPDGGPVRTPWGVRITPPATVQFATWARALGCETEPKLVSQQAEVRRFVYSARHDGPTLTAMYLDGHGHHWPGTKRVLPERILGPNTTTLNATEVLWEFFEQHTRPVP